MSGSPDQDYRGEDHDALIKVERDVQWLKYGVAVSAGSSVFSSVLALGAAPMPAAVAGGLAFVVGFFR